MLMKLLKVFCLCSSLLFLYQLWFIFWLSWIWVMVYIMSWLSRFIVVWLKYGFIDMLQLLQVYWNSVFLLFFWQFLWQISDIGIFMLLCVVIQMWLVLYFEVLQLIIGCIFSWWCLLVVVFSLNMVVGVVIEVQMQCSYGVLVLVLFFRFIEYVGLFVFMQLLWLFLNSRWMCFRFLECLVMVVQLLNSLKFLMNIVLLCVIQFFYCVCEVVLVGVVISLKFFVLLLVWIIQWLLQWLVLYLMLCWCGVSMVKVVGLLVGVQCFFEDMVLCMLMVMK